MPHVLVARRGRLPGLLLLASGALAFAAGDCSVRANALAERTKAPPLPPLVVERDAIGKKIWDYRLRVRGYYNGQQFDALETAAQEARTAKKRFGNGGWELFHFYDCLTCREDEPEAMWQLHDRIHEAWTAAYPESITARVAHAEFFATYAWHARSSGWAREVKPEALPIFEERLATARQILDGAAALKAKCPMWWRIQQTVAIGQGWPRAAFERLFEEAKAFEPQFWAHDLAHANYLQPRWYGGEGDWEKAAELEIARPRGLGVEGYARVVTSMRGDYENVFEETKASWPRVREGFVEMRRKYPDSLEILTGFTQLACLAGDRKLAQMLFLEIGGRVDPAVWGPGTEVFLSFREWAFDHSITTLPPLNPDSISR